MSWRCKYEKKITITYKHNEQKTEPSSLNKILASLTSAVQTRVLGLPDRRGEPRLLDEQYNHAIDDLDKQVDDQAWLPEGDNVIENEPEIDYPNDQIPDTPQTGDKGTTDENECKKIKIEIKEKDDDDGCNFNLGFDLTITPIIGVKLYRAIRVVSEYDIIVPIRGSIWIEGNPENTVCPNQKDKVCPKSNPTQTDLWLIPKFGIELRIKVAVGFRAPAFVGLITQLYKVGRLYNKIGKDFKALAEWIGEQSNKFIEEMKKIYDAMKTLREAWKTVKKEKNAASVLKMLGDFTVAIDAIKKANDHAKTKISGGARKLYSTALHRYNSAVRIYEKVESIAENMFAKTDFSKKWKSTKYTIWTYKAVKDDCKKVPETVLGTVKLKEIFLKGCCKDSKYGWSAHANPFINQYPYTDASNGYDEYNRYGEHHHRKQSLNSAPTLNNNGINNNNSYYDMIIMMDFFIIFIIAICCIGIICCIFGGITGLSAYYFTNKLNKQQLNQNDISTKHYVNINNDDQDDETDIENNDNML